MPDHSRLSSLFASRAGSDTDEAGSALTTIVESEKQEPEFTGEDPDHVPDGGITAWLQVVASFFCFFNSFGLINTYGVYQQYYSQELLVGWSPSDISWIGSLGGCLSLILAIFFAPLIDKGYIKEMALVGTLIQTFAMMMLSLCKKYYQVMLTQAVLIGIGASVLYLVGMSAVTPYFSKNRGFANGVAAAGASLGGVIYPIGLRKLFDRVGFGWSARIVGFIVLGTGLGAWLCVKRKVPPRKAGALIDWESFLDPKMMFFVAASFFAYAFKYMVFIYIQSYAVSFSNGANVATYTTAIINAASMFGRILPNYVADRVGLFNVLVPTMVACLVLAYCWIVVDHTGAIVAYSVLLGLFTSPFIALQSPIVASFTPDLKILGIRLGFTSIFTGGGTLLGPPIAGIMLRKHGWLWLKLLASFSMTVSVLFAIAARQLASRGKLFVKV